MDPRAVQGQAEQIAHTATAWRKIMRFDDELPIPIPQPGRLVPRNLEPLGVDELQYYIVTLREEIARAEAEITKKGHSRAAAEAFFRLQKDE
jgi:uncharacterized small protein (DUF1192 family)